MGDNSNRPSHRQPFECRRCSQCCTGEGGIYLESGEVPAAAAELGLESEEFIARYLKAKGGRFEVTCSEKGVCSLLGPKGCMIHQSKPAICRLWPFFPALLRDPGAFEEAKLACPGINPKASHEQFVAFAEKQKDQGLP